ncbi:hypothetical protein BJV85_003928 [Clostridium acetobutylicum]|nr:MULTISPECIES: hypothetical protein [Clostridium]ADZ22866.1 Conserved hypothetical protein [Clostridium acetobutylicum EA 2018]NOV90771.1 hypothetical protein [Clostridium acetobutylicum]NOW16539.1 hypothetical protein [Clostridium acetobutylicum]NRY58808.1 hypothetical protein [Clostridium acetobutylicum]NSA94981.1 hypothetical protein [Clostridium acetobutylicum]
MNKKIFFGSFTIIAFLVTTMAVYKNTHAILKASDTNIAKNSNKVHIKSNSFNPLTATDKELIEHGYPSKPNDKDGIEAWKKAVSVKVVKLEFGSPRPDGSHSIIVNP